LHSEQDEGDLTYFVMHHLEVIERAVSDLQTYLMNKVAESQRFQELLAAASRNFNHRQVALLQHAIKNPHAQYTVTSHAGSHNVVAQTARMDLQDLDRQGFLTKVMLGREYAWTPARNLTDLLEPADVGRRRRTPTKTLSPGAW
jgi:Fic family protein